MAETGKQSYTIDDFTTTYSTPIIQPGTLIRSEGREYRFVENQATDTATAGYPCVYMHSDPHDNDFQISADLSDGYTNCFAGIAMTDIASSEYGWVMRNGVYETCTISGAHTVGNQAVLSSADGGFAAYTAGDLEKPCGVIMTAGTTHATGVSIWIDAL